MYEEFLRILMYIEDEIYEECNRHYNCYDCPYIKCKCNPSQFEEMRKIAAAAFGKPTREE